MRSMLNTAKLVVRRDNRVFCPLSKEVLKADKVWREKESVYKELISDRAEANTALMVQRDLCNT